MFRRQRGEERSLAEYTGKPLIISLIYTSCYHMVPPRPSTSLPRGKARKVLGEDTVRVVTVGFHGARDTVDAMREFERAQHMARATGILADDAATVEKLAADLGFQYIAAGAGFDHLLYFGPMAVGAAAPPDSTAWISTPR